MQFKNRKQQAAVMSQYNKGRPESTVNPYQQNECKLDSIEKADVETLPRPNQEYYYDLRKRGLNHSDAFDKADSVQYDVVATKSKGMTHVVPIMRDKPKFNPPFAKSSATKQKNFDPPFAK